jgi:hypothetical protein
MRRSHDSFHTFSFQHVYPFLKTRNLQSSISHM